MYCNHCGSSNPDDSAYCSKCGRSVDRSQDRCEAQSISQVLPAPTEKIVSETSYSDANPNVGTEVRAGKSKPTDFTANPTQKLPYNWGKFQGWLILVAGPFIALDRSGWLAIVTVPLAIATGYAIVRRKKWAVEMTYAWIAYYVLISVLLVAVALTSKATTAEQWGYEIGQALGTVIVGSAFWLLCAMYYRKRRAEFS